MIWNKILEPSSSSGGGVGNSPEILSHLNFSGASHDQLQCAFEGHVLLFANLGREKTFVISILQPKNTSSIYSIEISNISHECEYIYYHYLGHMKLEIPFRKSSLSGSMLVVGGCTVPTCTLILSLEPNRTIFRKLQRTIDALCLQCCFPSSMGDASSNSRDGLHWTWEPLISMLMI